MKEINVIVAMTKSRVIGKDGTLPWHLPEDLKLFKAHTTGNIVIMGRKTFDSIGRPLPNRRNIVVSKSIREEEKVSGVDYFPDLEHAIEAAQEGSGRIFIIGGASIYRQMIEKADRLYISLVDGEFEGDTCFPEIREDVWKVVATEPHTGFELKIYEKKIMGDLTVDNLKLEIKKIIISALELEDIKPENIVDSEPLFGAGLGLDSIDALELGIALKKKFGISFSAESSDNRKHFASVDALAAYISAQKNGDAK